ncbi:methyltransferase family protein [Pseudaminobacter salicylatoxidans]|uniref:Methyltransferase family protein n=1 Tax=Pseudaminobacter salicylatoxidans TaxID=93369 RepID=A0A316BYU3_PSESE|nr:class I SAM-dependent methyltransferase [Pseudaminobacter salicylatoxidans]PWJ79828.1 methyltransferase family protein [Pseudaminobacter salicylatoxidans]
MVDMPHADEVESFIAEVTSDSCVERCAAATSFDAEYVAQTLATYSGELRVSMGLLTGVELRDRRILEVGAGLGLATFLLHRLGYDCTALEPAATGFGFMHALSAAIRDHLGLDNVRLLPLGAEDLDPDLHGVFDVMFSANVLEHIAKLEAAIHGMSRTLAADGIMIHTCPNYTVPFEPHYGVALFPSRPAMTPWTRRFHTEELWQSFNFITARQVERLSKQAQLQVRFEPGMMARAFERLLSDPVFAERQGATMVWLARALKWSGGLFVLRNWPASLATPMQFRATRPTSARSTRMR